MNFVGNRDCDNDGEASQIWTNPYLKTLPGIIQINLKLVKIVLQSVFSWITANITSKKC